MDFIVSIVEGHRQCIQCITEEALGEPQEWSEEEKGMEGWWVGAGQGGERAREGEAKERRGTTLATRMRSSTSGESNGDEIGAARAATSPRSAERDAAQQSASASVADPHSVHHTPTGVVSNVAYATPVDVAALPAVCATNVPPFHFSTSRL